MLTASSSDRAFRFCRLKNSIAGLDELNIGHSIISRAIMVGLDRAVRDMLDQIRLGEGEVPRK